MYREHEYYLKRCIEVSKASREHGNTPFGAILVDEDGNILLEQENVEISTHKSTGHAETQLAEKASTMYSKDFLWKCTLYNRRAMCNVRRLYLLVQYRPRRLCNDRKGSAVTDRI